MATVTVTVILDLWILIVSLALMPAIKTSLTILIASLMIGAKDVGPLRVTWRTRSLSLRSHLASEGLINTKSDVLSPIYVMSRSVL